MAPGEFDIDFIIAIKYFSIIFSYLISNIMLSHLKSSCLCSNDSSVASENGYKPLFGQVNPVVWQL